MELIHFLAIEGCTALGRLDKMRRVMTQPFSVRVYYEDTDAGGVVYYANYMKFAERARTEMLRSLGIGQMELMRDHDAAFMVRRCEIEFFKPAMLDDLLTIQTRITDIAGATLEMQQAILRDGETLVELNVRLATINPKTGKPARIPAHVKAALKH